MKRDNRRGNFKSKVKPRKKIIKLCSIYQITVSVLLIVLIFTFYRIPNLSHVYGNSLKNQLSKNYDVIEIYENAISEVESVDFNIN